MSDGRSTAVGLGDEATAEERALCAATQILEESQAATTELQIELCEIAAPIGQEEVRAEAVAHWLRTTGCRVEMDEAGNVIAARAGSAGGPAIALSAHIDTVFPATQPVRVVRGGEASPYRDGAIVPKGELHAPGICDDAAGLAAMIAVAQALSVADVRTQRDVLFVATVGEEGLGNLKGARQLFSQPLGQELAAFITIDHPEADVIVNRGIGSRRYAVEFRGPGGHSWGDFGRYNPAQAMASAGQRIGAMTTPAGDRSAYNIGVMESGRSVNAIPDSARMEIDLRSESSASLDILETALREAIAAGHAEELARRPGDPARYDILPIGERPAGETAADSPLVIAAQRALSAEGFEPRLRSSSTDANAGMAAGVPSICVSWGGKSEHLHSVRESFSPEGQGRSLAAIVRLLLEMTGVGA